MAYLGHFRAVLSMQLYDCGKLLASPARDGADWLLWETEDRSGLNQTEIRRRRRAMTTKTWNGSNADWYTNNGGDWSPPGDPGSGDAVVINSGEAQLLSGDAAINVASISIGGSGFLAIQDPGATQSVSGN